MVTSYITGCVVLHIRIPTWPLSGGEHDRTVTSRGDLPMTLWSRISLPTSDVSIIVILYVQVPVSPSPCGNEEELLVWCEDELSLVSRKAIPAPDVALLVILHINTPAWPFNCRHTKYSSGPIVSSPDPSLCEERGWGLGTEGVGSGDETTGPTERQRSGLILSDVYGIYASNFHINFTLSHAVRLDADS